MPSRQKNGSSLVDPAKKAAFSVTVDVVAGQARDRWRDEVGEDRSDIGRHIPEDRAETVQSIPDSVSHPVQPANLQ